MASIKLASVAGASCGTFASLSAGHAVALSEVDLSLSGNSYPRASFEVLAKFGTGPTANTMIHLYVVYAIDGTNYEDFTAGSSPVMKVGQYVGSVPVASVTTQQRFLVRDVPVLPKKMKVVVLNSTNQATTSGTTAENEVKITGVYANTTS